MQACLLFLFDEKAFQQKTINSQVEKLNFMSVFLWIIFIFITIYYGFQLFFRYVLPWLLARFIRKQQEKFSSMNQNHSSKDEIKVNKKNKSNSKSDDGSFGEYIDFEEIKE